MSFKSNVMSSSTAVIRRLHDVKPVNWALNPADGVRFGIQHGDWVSISTPGGSREAQISLLAGVMPGVIAVEHGYGHREMGPAGTIWTANRWRWMSASPPASTLTIWALPIRRAKCRTPGWIG